MKLTAPMNRALTWLCKDSDLWLASIGDGMVYFGADDRFKVKFETVSALKRRGLAIEYGRGGRICATDAGRAVHRALPVEVE